ncbi:hypothetical protein GCM10009547_15630 [Sporichthya brevicatena]|uniref:LytR/CpsA/Psr regulator C-terminal domain-containing protein n=1 Tax=Sporichthya brevicatena TaxID=171442 RepID=A0ABP3RPN4_9ACTN
MAPGEPRRGASLLSILASSALAALAVIVLVGVLILAFGTDDDPAAEQAGPAATASPAPGQPAAPTPTPEPAAPTPSPTPRPAAKVPVVVFNQTTVRGLAQTFADELTAGGWTVAGVDDWRGNVPATTVYFPPGLRPAAKALMAQFPQIGRIRPAFAGISTTQLTVILSKDFPTSG